MPEELKFRYRDHWMPFMRHGSAVDREKEDIIPAYVVERLRHEKRPRSGDRGFGVDYREVSARVREILKADNLWQKAQDRLQARLDAKYDVGANIRRWEALDERRNSLMDRALDSKAKTIDGVMVKVGFRKWFNDYDPDLDAGGPIDEITTSICDDLEAIAAAISR